MIVSYSSNGGLEAFAERLKTLGSSAGHEAMSAAVAEGVEESLAEEFASAADPSGDAWAPRIADFPWPMLDKEGDLKGSGHALPSPSGIGALVFFDDFKATFFQTGTKRMVARPLLPTDGTIPAPWLDKIAPKVELVIANLIEGR